MTEGDRNDGAPPGILGTGLYRLYARALASRPHRWGLYLLWLTVLASMILRVAGSPHWEPVGVPACSGGVIYMGILLFSVLPRQREARVTYGLFALSMIIAGLAFAVISALEWVTR